MLDFGDDSLSSHTVTSKDGSLNVKEEESSNFFRDCSMYQYHLNTESEKNLD